MNKRELHDYLKANTKDKKKWEEAFKLYNSEKRQFLKMSCSKCYEKVFTWLSKS